MTPTPTPAKIPLSPSAFEKEDTIQRTNPTAPSIAKPKNGAPACFLMMLMGTPGPAALGDDVASNMGSWLKSMPQVKHLGPFPLLVTELD